MFTLGYSNSPAMFANMGYFGAKYPFTLYDADGEVFDGNRPYMMRFPPGIPAKLFWSVTRYAPATGAGLDNGQPFASLNQMDQPVTNADGSVDVYFGPEPPGAGGTGSPLPTPAFSFCSGSTVPPGPSSTSHANPTTSSKSIDNASAITGRRISPDIRSDAPFLKDATSRRRRCPPPQTERPRCVGTSRAAPNHPNRRHRTPSRFADLVAVDRGDNVAEHEVG
jgi:hypothetical protein